MAWIILPASVDTKQQSDAYANRSLALADRITRLDEPTILSLWRRPEHEIGHERRTDFPIFARPLGPPWPKADHEFNCLGKGEWFPEHNLGLPLRVPAPHQLCAANLNL